MCGIPACLSHPLFEISNQQGVSEIAQSSAKKTELFRQGRAARGSFRVLTCIVRVDVGLWRRMLTMQGIGEQYFVDLVS